MNLLVGLSLAEGMSPSDRIAAVCMVARLLLMLPVNLTSVMRTPSNSAIESQKMNVGRATNGSPVFQCKMIELPDIYNLRINNYNKDVPACAETLKSVRQFASGFRRTRPPAAFYSWQWRLFPLKHELF
jgi:hypothetical protein